LLGLIVGKPVGILLFAFTAVKLKLSRLAHDMNWSHVAGAGLLGGIGFTMSIFIMLLAFEEGMLVIQSKVAILVSSVVSGVCGFMYLSVKNKKEK
jgi:NhaA family Na+:H+ antiporter